MRRASFPLAFLVAAALSLPFLGARDLWAPDEPRYAEVAVETLRDGHWWYPHVNGRPYPDKPPLYFWAAAALAAPSGHVTETTARLPSALSALLLVLLTAAVGRDLLGEREARLGALLLATTWLPAWLARRANLDVAVAACALLAAWCALRAGTASRARSSLWAAASGLAVAAGVMVKGPVVLLPVAALLLPLAWHAERRASRAPGALWTGLGVAALAFGFGIAAWLVPAHVLGGYAPWDVVEEHVLARAASGRDHVQPIWYYLTTLPADLMPWTLLAAPAVWSCLRRVRRLTSGHVAILSAALAPVVVLSLIVEKRNVYLLAAFPALALLTARWVVDAEDTPAARHAGLRRGLVGIGGLFGLLALAAGVVAIAGARIPPLATAMALPLVRPAAVAVALVATLAAAFILLRARSDAPLAAVRGTALATAACLAAVFLSLPAFDPLKSARAFSEDLMAEIGDAPAAFYPGGDASRWAAYVFHSGRTFAETSGRADLEAWLASAPRPAHVLTYDRHLRELPLDGEVAPTVLLSGGVGHREPTLVRYEHVVLPQAPEGELAK